MPNRVVVTGLGLITSIGNNRAQVTESLRELRHGFENVVFMDNPRIPVKVAGTIKEFKTNSSNWVDWEYPDHYQLDVDYLKSLSPHGLHCLCAMLQAIEDSGLEQDQVSSVDTGLFASSAGSTFMMRHNLESMIATNGMRINPMSVVCSVSGTLNFNLGAYFGIRGGNLGFVSACASSSHAIGYGFDEISLGRHKRIFVVGGEELTAETYLPFNGMRALSRNPDPNTASRPFDVKRDGFVGTGGGVALLLEDMDEAKKRGAKIYAELVNWGQASDGYNIAMPHPEGSGLTLAMKKALKAAKVNPEDVDYVNAHATSTPPGDKSEALSLVAIFGTDKDKRPAVSSTKALTGHGLSMAGVMEAAFSVIAMKDGFIPGAAHISEPDPLCEHITLPKETLDQAPNTVISNSSGFGGSNVCLVFKKWDG